MLVMREGVRGRLRSQWAVTAEHARRYRWQLLGAVLDRVAPAELRHAALLLGYDVALGHGRRGVLGYMHEFHVGTELGRAVRYGAPEQREGAVEALIMELCLFS